MKCRPIEVASWKAQVRLPWEEHAAAHQHCQAGGAEGGGGVGLGCVWQKALGIPRSMQFRPIEIASCKAQVRLSWEEHPAMRQHCQQAGQGNGGGGGGGGVADLGKGVGKERSAYPEA